MGRLVLVGGTKLTEEALPSGAVWVLDPAKGTWKSLGVLPGVAPPAVAAPSLTLDPQSGTLIRLGGHTISGEAGGAWRLDPVALTWEPLPGSKTGGSLLRGHSAAWDPQGGLVVVAGGLGPGDDPSEHVQTYDPASGEWALVGIVSALHPWRPALAIDSASRLALVGDGDDLSVLDLAGEAAPIVLADEDAAVPGAAAIYDVPRRRAVLVGGRSESGAPSDAVRALTSTCEN
jgi:hypothetical protein